MSAAHALHLVPSIPLGTRPHDVPKTPAAETPLISSPAAGVTPPARVAERHDARLAVLAEAAAFARANGLSQAAADRRYVAAYAAGRTATPAWVRAAVDTVSARSLARWRAAAARGKPLAADPAAARAGSGILDQAEAGAVRAFMLAFVAAQPLASAKAIRAAVTAKFGGRLAIAGEPHSVPPLRTFQHALKALRTAHKNDLLALTDPDRYRSTVRFRGRGALAHIRHPNEFWQIDSSPADVLCKDGRHQLYVCSDIGPRRLKLYVARTARAEAVGLLLRRAILAWGVPQKIKSDNGSDFVARQTQRVMAALDIEHERSDAYSPEQKGHVERAIGTVQRGLMRYLPGFVGHSVADRKAIEGRKSFARRLGDRPAETFGVDLTGAELQAWCDHWADHVYANEPHAGLGGRTPAQMAAAATGTIRMVDPRALDILLAPVAGGDGYRIVTASGLRLDHAHYQFVGAEVGTRVFVRRDPADLGRLLVFAGEAGEYLGEAICPALAGLDPAEVTEASRRLQAQLLHERTAGIKEEVKRLTRGTAMAELVFSARAEAAQTSPPLPARVIEHRTPALTAAAAAARTNDNAPRRLAADEAADLAALVAETRALPRPAVETGVDRFRRALGIERGGPASDADRAWLRSYQASAEYQNYRDLYQDFGDRIFAEGGK